MILEIVRARLPGSAEGALSAHSDLWNAGMDSLLSVAVEDEFGIEFPDELLTWDAFASVANIADAVDRVLGRASR